MTEEQEPKRGIDLGQLRFHKILATVEQELKTALAKARLESDHGPSIGDGAEEPVRNVLRSYLPSGYGVGKGHIYDAYGDGSRQTDVIVTNPDHPLSFPEGKSGTYVVDGVSAAGEVKARLDAGALRDCIKKGIAFKKLRMTVNDSDHVMTSKDQDYMEQIGMVPPFFVIAFENKISPETMAKTLGEEDLVPPPKGKSLGKEDWADSSQPPLDAICILGHGLWMYLRPNNPMGFGVKIDHSDGSATLRNDVFGWAFIETDAPLSLTLAWLNAAMPRVFRGQSVFSPYLIPPQKHLRYMRLRDGAAAAEAAAPETDDMHPGGEG